MLRTIILCSAVVLFFGNTAHTQAYKTAAGLRVGQGIHPTVQQHLFGKWTVEGILHTSFQSTELGVSLLAERHHKLLFRGINLYYGAGGHYYGRNGTNLSEGGGTDDIYGLSFIGGAEITLGKFNISVDFKPEIHLAGYDVQPFAWTGMAVSVRRVLFKREKEKIWNLFGKK
ncbi:MAG: hypothetical protein SFV52_13860 [Saprospiraceae bacterium]|nr:hypothetical protein [Saprospiraceae bacterium]